MARLKPENMIEAADIQTSEPVATAEAEGHSDQRLVTPPVHVISLGAGVQSSAMAIMACHGLLKPMPDCAVFADTGDESEETYRWIKELCRLLTFPVVWLKHPPGYKLSDALVNEWGHSQIPAWYANSDGNPAIGRRQCTKYFKILPVRHYLRNQYPGRNVMLWMGISVDEVSRMKESGRLWLEHRWPLIELRKSRSDCAAFLKTVTSWKVPKSACVYCPYKNSARWRKSTELPYEMKIINRVESVLNPRNEYLTKHLKPVSHINFDSEEDRGQTDLWPNECEGMCGV